MHGNDDRRSPAATRMRLGLVADAALLRASPPGLIPLLARAGWGIAWMETSPPEPAALPIAAVIGPGAPLPSPAPGEVWLRGDHGAARVADEVSRLRTLAVPPQIGVDARDRAGLDLAHRLGVTPVLGPAPLADILALAAIAAPAGGSAGGTSVLLPVSVGRTDAEARARMHHDPWLCGLAAGGSVLVGTLEACQDAVISLAGAGVTDLRMRPAATSDLPDVLAQLSVLGRSALHRLGPGVPRSAAPPAPADWGGRPG